MSRIATHLYFILRASAIILALLPTACTVAKASGSPERPNVIHTATAANAKEIAPDMAAMYHHLIAPDQSLADRMMTARRLLDSTDPTSTNVLALTLKTDQPADVRRAVTQAIATDIHNPPAGLEGVLLEHIGDFGEATRSDAAAALSRYMGRTLQEKLLAIAKNEKATDGARETALRTLGYEREQKVASVLIHFAGPDQPEAVQRGALAGLTTMRGQSFADDDYASWQAWWEKARQWSQSQWRAHLSADFAAQAIRSEMVRQQLVNKLLETEQTIYQQAAKKDRPTVIIKMLNDATEPVRKLGMQLSLQRLLDDQTFPDALTDALRKRLTDPASEIRRRAMSLLRDLADKPAAEIVADRLARGDIHGPGCLKAALLLLQRLPQTQAVGPAYELMSNPRFRPEAAGVLAAAADAGLLPEPMAKQAAARARAYLKAGNTPEPEMIELLGKVGNDADFKQIAYWIRSSNTQVKQAAAQAWADAGRPLTVLAMHADDPVIQPIVLAAAAERGKTQQAMLALASHPPTSTQALEAWRRAMVAMAKRVPGEGVLRVVDNLDGQKSPDTQTIEKMLTAAIQAEKKVNGDKLHATQGKLMIVRGEHRLAAGNAADALGDFKAAAGITDLSPAMRKASAKGALMAYLALGQVNDAFSLAKQLLEKNRSSIEPLIQPATQPATQPAVPSAATQPWHKVQLNASTIAVAFEAHIRTLGKGKENQALTELLRLSKLLGKQTPASVNKRIADLRTLLADRQIPATQPAKSTKTPQKNARPKSTATPSGNNGAMAKKLTPATRP